MQDDEPGQEPVTEPGTEGGSSAPDPRDDEIRRLKDENKSLRASRRTETAKRLVKEHELPEGLSGLLELVPEDQMEEKALAVKDSMVPGAPAAPPEPPSEPPESGSLAAMAAGGGDAGGTPVGGAEPQEPDQELRDRINKAESQDDLIRIQQEAIEARRRHRVPPPK